MIWSLFDSSCDIPVSFIARTVCAMDERSESDYNAAV
jgi:hypothetical protein